MLRRAHSSLEASSRCQFHHDNDEIVVALRSSGEAVYRCKNVGNEYLGIIGAMLSPRIRRGCSMPNTSPTPFCVSMPSI